MVARNTSADEHRRYIALDGRGLDYWQHVILSILGWQGGTIHQMADEVRRLKAVEEDFAAAQAIIQSLAARVAAQSELLSKRADK